MNTKKALEIAQEMETELWQMVGALRKVEVENNPKLVGHLVNLLSEVANFGDLLEKKKGALCLN